MHAARTRIGKTSRRMVTGRNLLGFFTLLLCLTSSPPAKAATFIVNSTADVVDQSPGSGRCFDSPNFACTTDADCTNAGHDGPCMLCATGRTAPSNPTVPECTVRAAIQEANTTDGVDTINVSAGTYTLTIPGVGENAAAVGDLDITKDLTIIGGAQPIPSSRRAR